MRRRTFPTRHPATIVAVLLLVALPTVVGVTHLAAAQDPGSLRSHINRQKGVERQLASAAARLGRLERATSRAVDVMSGRLAETQGELARWQARLAETQRQLRDTRERLVRLRARLAESRRALATMLRQRYTADKPDVVSVVLDAKGFADVLERIEFLRRVQRSDTVIVDAVRRGRDDARHDERLLAALEPRQREQTAAVASQRDALARMTAALQSRRAALAQARAARLAALSNTIASRRRAQRELSRLLAAQARAAASQGPGGPWSIPWPIVECESGGQNLPPNSASASGYYQMLDSTWHGLGGSTPHAYQASKAEQDRLAAKLWAGGSGAHNWVCAAIVGTCRIDLRSSELVRVVATARRPRRRPCQGMDDVVRIIDGDPASLDRRVARLLERVGADWRVARFTYWYTGRPPVHEALVVRPPASSGA
jgi:peptidoglycan hydrolase CwlO-like protein